MALDRRAPACVLPDGRLIMGSVNDTRTAIYDPAANSWSDGPAKNDASRNETWTLLPDGTVFCVDVQAHPHTEKYVPALRQPLGERRIHTRRERSRPADHPGSAHRPGRADGRRPGVRHRCQRAHRSLHTCAGSGRRWQLGGWARFPCRRLRPAMGGAEGARRPAAERTGPLHRRLRQARKPVGYAGEPCRAFEFDGTALTQVLDPPYADDSYTWQYRLLLLPTGEVLCATGDEHAGTGEFTCIGPMVSRTRRGHP